MQMNQKYSNHLQRKIESMLQEMSVVQEKLGMLTTEQSNLPVVPFFIFLPEKILKESNLPVVPFFIFLPEKILKEIHF